MKSDKIQIVLARLTLITRMQSISIEWQSSISECQEICFISERQGSKNNNRKQTQNSHDKFELELLPPPSSAPKRLLSLALVSYISLRLLPLTYLTLSCSSVLTYSLRVLLRSDRKLVRERDNGITADVYCVQCTCACFVSDRGAKNRL